MLRKIIKIDSQKCNGCGACAAACHEGAIAMVDGKAKLIRDDYCDGLGDCLPACPTNAISFEMRQAAAYDEAAVRAHLSSRPSVSPSSGDQKSSREMAAGSSALSNWPVQIKLLPVEAPYFHQADLLIAADCTAFAHGSFHDTFMKNRVTIIGCPKLDMVDYTEKLAEIFRRNPISSITLTRMEVPCCGGLAQAVKAARKLSGRNIPMKTYIINIQGEILKEIKED
ncbi:MAG TPA: 4Fe-4S binding protein [Candidatus Blautia gallistercoris]|uniref:4Fe-4S binding protein n=1 Tax=Candidatus Blautia gallistercoris TaxID=2838490 RepID=A0A9D1WHM3_9FIRM|nr:4Fe-4S binding protein [Candidatus Blautia gallistercoris]